MTKQTKREPGWMPTYRGDHLDDRERELDRIESSWADWTHGLRTGLRFIRDGSFGEKARTLSLVHVKAQLDVYQSRFRAGEPTALIEAVSYSAEEGVPMPYWLRHEVMRRIEQTFEEAISLHEAFGLEGVLPSAGKKAETSRKFARSASHIYHLVCAMRNFEGLSTHAAIKKALTVHRFPFGLTKATALINDQDRVNRLHAEQMPGISRALRVTAHEVKGSRGTAIVPEKRRRK